MRGPAANIRTVLYHRGQRRTAPDRPGPAGRGVPPST
jgi:hypothetical protein